MSSKKPAKSLTGWMVIYPDGELLLGNLYATEYTARLCAKSKYGRKHSGKVVRVRIAPEPQRKKP